MTNNSNSNISRPITTEDGMQAMSEFFSRMSQYCAAVDFDATEVLFAPDVISFGTKASIVRGLQQLRSDQWEHIWPNISGFQMQVEALEGASRGDLAWGMLPWTSRGIDASGAQFTRPGRATAILERRDGEWVCVHTHFSLNPAATNAGAVAS